MTARESQLNGYTLHHQIDVFSPFKKKGEVEIAMTMLGAGAKSKRGYCH